MASTQGVILGLVLFAALLNSGQAQLNRACLSRLDVLVVFDSSGSITFSNFNNWVMAKNTTKNYLDSFDIGPNRVHIAIMIVSDQAVVVVDFSRQMSRQQVYSTIDGLQMSPSSIGTNLADGFDVALTTIFSRSRGMRDNVKGVLLLLSDGIATIRQSDTIPMANKLKSDKGIMIVPIAISGAVDMKVLKAVSSSTAQPIVTFDHLYITKNFLESQRLEICILLDASGSITFLNYNNWWYAKLFLEYILASLWSDSSRVKVSVITFNETARMRFKLGEIDNLPNIVAAIRSLDHSGGATNIAAALTMVDTQVFPQPMGDQPSLKWLVLLITDGIPTNGLGEEELKAVSLKRKGVEIVSVVVEGERQIDRTRLRRLASIISSSGNNLKPAVIEVSDYRGLAAKGNVVVDTICSIPPNRDPDSDLNVPCYKTCYDGPGGSRLWGGNYHYCEGGSITNVEQCRNYLHCPTDTRVSGIMIVCPLGLVFDNSLKACVWKTCSCPGNKRFCFRPRI